MEPKQEFVFRSKLPDIYVPSHLSVHSYCFENLSLSKHRPCLINGSTGESFTHGEVDLSARRVASGLNKLGIKQGQVIMLLLQNCHQYVFAFLGASYLGAIITSANPLYTSAEIAKQAKASNAKLIITHAAFVDKVYDFAKENGTKLMYVDHHVQSLSILGGLLSFEELTQADENSMPIVEINPYDIVTIPYSSGTTGMPKGVLLSHESMVTSMSKLVDGENPNLYFHNEDVILCALPMFHIYALHSVLLCGIRAGATILIMQKFDMVKMFELVQKYKVTIAPFVPPILLGITKNPQVHNYDLSSIRMVISGAAPLGKELEDALRGVLPNATLGQGCGMTEAGPVAMSLSFAKYPFKVKSGSCGTVIRNTEMKIVDPQTGKSLDRNQAGEICVRGNHIMKGYLNDPEATKSTIDKDGWLHTGDIGYVDDDDELFIVDRLKELIKYKGFQVAPAELEALLLSHPNLSDAAVVPMEDEAAGEVPVAFVVKKNGIKLNEEEIKQYISKQVVFYKRLAKVFFTDAIPRAPSGKVLRKDLKARLPVLTAAQ